MTTFILEHEYVQVHCGGGGPDSRCDTYFAMNEDFYALTKRTGQTWYCPNGHARVWGGDTTEAKLKKAEAKQVALQDQLGAAIRDAENTRVALLRDRQRFANGVCPCCNRSFENVARHMRGEHPDYDVTKVKQQARPTFKCGCGHSFETLRGLRIHQGHQRRPGWDKSNASRWSAHLTSV